MKSFLQFITEMPKAINTVPPIGKRDETDLDIDYRKTHFRYATKVSKFDSDHSIYQYDHDINKARGYLVIHNKTHKIKGLITGMSPKDDKTAIRARWTVKHSSAPFKMNDVFHHIIQNHGHVESSTEHSKGSIANWKNLSERPDVEITHHDEEGNQIHLHRGVDFHKNYETHDSYFIARKKT